MRIKIALYHCLPTLLLLFLLPTVSDAQEFMWAKSVYVEAEGSASPKITHAAADAAGVTTVGVEQPSGLNSPLVPFIARNDREGGKLWSRRLPRYIDPALPVATNFVLRGNAVRVIAGTNGDTWVWGFYDYEPSGVEYPTVILRYRIDGEGELIGTDTLFLDYRIDAASFTLRPDGSIHLNPTLSTFAGSMRDVLVRYWDGDLADGDSLVLSLSDQALTPEMQVVDHIVSDEHVFLLMTDSATFETAVVSYDRLDGSTRVTKLEMAAEDLFVDDDGTLLVLGRVISEDGFIDGVALRCARVERDGSVGLSEEIIGDVSSSASIAIVGVTEGELVYITWAEGNAGAIYVLNPDGSRRGTFMVYEPTPLHAEFPGDFYIGSNSDLYVVMGIYQYGRLSVLDRLSSIHEIPVAPLVRLEIR